MPEQSVPLSTTEALRRLAQGPDECAWTTVLNRHGADILRATQRILGDPMSAEDACQETLLQIRDRAGQFRGRPSVSATDSTARNWIMRIACNTALHMLRKRKRAQLREQHVAANATVISPEPEYTHEPQEDLAARVRFELAELPETQRLPLVLHFYAGLDYAQISSELRCNVGAARVRVHRAIEKLRRRLAVLGVVLTAAALYSLLSGATATAAEAVLSPERFARWQGLLFSSQQATLNVVSDPHFHTLGKVGYAAACAALAGTLAASYSHKTPEPSPIISAPAKVVSIAKAPLTAPVAAPAIIERAEVPEAAPVVVAPAPRAFPRTARPLNPAPETASVQTAPASVRESAFVSPLAQLEMLQSLQHELNQRVTRIHQDIEARFALSGGELTAEEQSRLNRAAEDQAELSNLVQKIADEIRTAQPSESHQANLRQ